MTVSSEPVTLSFSGDGTTTAFTISWKYFAKADVRATLRDSDNAETEWTLSTDYTLSAAGVATGGTLTATTAPASGETLVIDLDIDNTQDTSYSRGGDLPSKTIEDDLDKAVQRISKLEEQLKRCMQFPVTDLRTGSSAALPIDTTRASKFLGFDSSGIPEMLDGTSTLSVAGLISQDAESELTIASGSVTPTGAEHSIDTESDASTDFLDTIVTTNLSNGRILLLRGNNAARVTTVRDQQGGAGQIHTVSGENVPLLGTTNFMLLQRRDDDWYELQLGFSLGQGQGADIVSAAELPVAIPGAFHDVTGANAITSLAAVGIGTIKILQFDAALTLTHHATNLILPGAANITTAAGDIGIFYEYAAGDYRCVSYVRAADEPINYSGMPAITVDSITINENTISCATGSNLEIVPFAGQNIRLDNTVIIDAGVITGVTSLTVATDILFTADGTVDIGKTGTRAANIWSDLVNGADYGFENGWRALEADTYEGYGAGIAFGVGDYFKAGEALGTKKVLTGRKVDLKDANGDVVEIIDETRRERVTDVKETPVFAVTDDFIEFKGRRITCEQLDKLLKSVE